MYAQFQVFKTRSNTIYISAWGLKKRRRGQRAERDRKLQGSKLTGTIKTHSKNQQRAVSTFTSNWDDTQLAGRHAAGHFSFSVFYTHTHKQRTHSVTWKQTFTGTRVQPTNTQHQLNIYIPLHRCSWSWYLKGKEVFLCDTVIWKPCLALD